MQDRNVLVIAYYFPPMGLSGVQRTAKFVKYLPDYGWRPIVLTTNSSSYYAFDETLQKDFADKDILIYRTEKNNQKGIRNVTKFPSYFKQKLGRAFLLTIYQPDSKIKWKKQAEKLGEKIIGEHKISAIFATAPPFTDFLIAKDLSIRFNIPFIVDYRDVWVDNPFHFYATPFHKSYSIKLESEILTHAQKIIVTTRHTKELLLKRYRFISHEDILIIPHGYDPEDFAGFVGIQPNPFKFTLTHSGLFQDNRTPEHFLIALSLFLKKNKEARSSLEARFVGLMRPSHLKLIKKLSLFDNINITGYLNHNEAVRQLLESDVLWLTLNDNVRSPGKLYEYFGARKPLLVCAPDGVIRKAVIDSKAGIGVDPEDVNAISHTIETFYNLWKNKTLPEPKDDFINQFNRKKLTEDLARELSLASEI